MNGGGQSEPVLSGGVSPRGQSAWNSALLEALFAEAPIGLGFWDTELRYQRVNDVLATMNGVAVEEHLGRRVSEVLPELGPQLEGLLTEILATGEARPDCHIEGATPAAPGVTRHWLASYFPVRASDGAMVGIAATVVEVTAQRVASARAGRAERREEAIDAQLRAVYSALPLGVGFVTPDLRYERVNGALAQINGLSVEDHLGRTVREVVGERGAQAEELIRQVIERRAPTNFEVAVGAPAASDRERVLEVTYFPVFAPEGVLLGVGVVARDVTERRALEQERERLLNEALTARDEAQAARARAEAAREEADAARRRAGFLATVTRRMAASMDYEETLREVVASAVPHIADWGVVTVVEADGRPRVLGPVHRDPDREQLVRKFAQDYQPGPRSSVYEVLRTGAPVLVTDMTDEALAAMARDDKHLHLLAELGMRHLGTWPIPAPDGRVIGALSFILGESGRRFSAQDLDLAQAVATRAGLHITNARLYTERTEIARTLQASLLVRELPSIPGVELASAFLPAGGEAIVGGDFFDVFASADGMWTAILGDVSGKGAKAAAITAAARHTLRAAALVEPDPAANLALLNRVLTTDLAGGAYCTVVYARLCPRPGELAAEIANGGHPPPLVLRADGNVEWLPAGGGPLVGVFRDATFQTTKLDLTAGDVLLLYTDGVTEIRSGDRWLGEEDLASTLVDHRGQTAARLVEAIQRRALGLQAGAARDDIAMLAIRVLG
jgi:PAS domain S-box-containing protein